VVLAVTTLPVYTKHVIYSGESTTLRPVKANNERYQNAFSKFYTYSCIYEHATGKLYLLSKAFSYHHRNNNNNNNNNNLQSAELQLYSIGELSPLMPGSRDVSSNLKLRANDASDIS